MRTPRRTNAEFSPTKRRQKGAFNPTKAVRHQRIHQPAFQGLILSEALWREPAAGSKLKPDPGREAASLSLSLLFRPNKHCADRPSQASTEASVQAECVCVRVPRDCRRGVKEMWSGKGEALCAPKQNHHAGCGRGAFQRSQAAGNGPETVRSGTLHGWVAGHHQQHTSLPSIHLHPGVGQNALPRT